MKPKQPKEKAVEKICRICKQRIKDEDNYVRLTDYKRGDFFMECFYHTLCYNNQLQRKNPEQIAMKNTAAKLLNKAHFLLNKVQPEVYDIH